ncbi:queuosine precursor transporter [Paenibacillus sp. MZ04-78.2]|uniref:queuosine precursor transporter n=1 Tax=Paenibacillus sp. MZ04-78.2 TaxID=2962034 RepID=UPI0020B8939B|nr:queuosine precursor transporter [Paenibacillus sp. MZ04-78.2]MCP3774880.1 queuosine precursor transporter [Paenibacillus sp. MZ04-78.2]
MFNLAWGILFVVVNFALFLLCYRFFGKKGLYAWIGFATVLANIQVVKTIELLGIVMTLGNTVYTSIYMSTDLLNEKYGTKEAKQAVWFGFFSLVASTVIMQMSLVFTPQESDIAQSSLEKIFGLMPRLAAGSLCAYFISQFLDVRVYSYLKKRFPVYNQFWIRTNGSTGLSQLVDSLVFCTIAFAGVYTLDIWLQILLTTYLFKFVISVASTPVLYIARSFRIKEDRA